MSHITSNINGRECFIYNSDEPRYILIQTLGNHERGIFDTTAELIASTTDVPFALAAFQVFDWDLDLTPWHDDAINRKPEVGTMTGDTLRYVEELLLPALENEYGKLPVILGGYSLGDSSPSGLLRKRIVLLLSQRHRLPSGSGTGLTLLKLIR